MKIWLILFQALKIQLPASGSYVFVGKKLIFFSFDFLKITVDLPEGITALKKKIIVNISFFTKLPMFYWNVNIMCFLKTL